LPRAAGLVLAAALVPLAGTGVAAPGAHAQVRASLDAGASHVTYEGFLPSAAVSLAPSLSLARNRLALVARGSWLRFESGNNSLQGIVAGSWSFPASPGVVVDLGTEVGGSRYEEFASFTRLLGRARLGFHSSGGKSSWVAATAGVVSSESDARSFHSLAGAFRLDRRLLTLAVSATATVIGALTYADVEAGIRRGRPGSLEMEATISARAGDRGGDPGPRLEATLTMPLATGVSAILAGGTYPEDPVRGSVAGRYVTAAVRLAAPVRRARPITAALPAPPPAGDGAGAAAALLETRRGPGTACTLVMHATGAATVEVMADFTDWLPVALEPTGRESWTLTLAIPPGRHRLNVRINGGPWTVAGGTTAEDDEFWGTVGAVVIP
jgi:hypothetical protein